MKKTILLFLLILAMLLCACESASSKPSETTVEEQTEVSDLPAEDDDYKEIERRTPESYTQHLFGIQDSNVVLKLDFPSDWTPVSEDKSCFSITRNGERIGALILGESEELLGWKVVDSDDSTNTNVKMKMQIEKRGAKETLEFRYRFQYDYTEGETPYKISLLVKLDEINDYTQKRLLIAPDVGQLRTDPALGSLSIARADKILILGNSFINSSSIGNILQEMLQKNGKSNNVQPISRGYATVETYINDAMMMENIRGGAYDIIFICGFYSTSEVANLKTLQSACDASQTPLVIFPAHNESEAAVSAAQRETDLHLLNWREEINMLIRHGVDQWDFCIDDMHRHSTPLAGYVGAHMIYRALYGAIPTASLSATIDQSYVNSLLGDYPQTGSIALIDASKAVYFGK